MGSSEREQRAGSAGSSMLCLRIPNKMRSRWLDTAEAEAEAAGAGGSEINLSAWVRKVVEEHCDDADTALPSPVGGWRGLLFDPVSVARDEFTERQQVVLRCVGAGLKNREIARRLGVQLSTVHGHLDALYKKTGARSRQDLARFATTLGPAPADIDLRALEHGGDQSVDPTAEGIAASSESTASALRPR